MSNLAIIPARSGSKGVPNKNIRLLNGKPLMAYTIEAALESAVFDEVMVSTDSEEYARIAMIYGAKVPFLRSSEMSSDSASSWETATEILKKYMDIKRNFDSFCLLQPTSPLRTAEDIVKAYELFSSKSAVSVVSLCQCEHSPLWCNTLNEEMELNGFCKTQNIGQRQSLESYYRINGAIYFVNVKAFMEDSYIYREGSYAYLMSQENSIDIDNEFDFKLAEFLMG